MDSSNSCVIDNLWSLKMNFIEENNRSTDTWVTGMALRIFAVVRSGSSNCLFLDLNNNRSLVAAAVNVRFRSKQGLCQRFIVYKEKVNCQLSHPLSTVTVYIAKLLNLIRTLFSVPVMFSQNIKGLMQKADFF